MKTAILLIYVALVSVPQVEARLGETLGQCADRYGAILDSSGDERNFEKNGYRITVHFHDGKADRILYAKTALEGFLRQPAELSTEEIGELLKKNSAGMWKKSVTSNLLCDEWVSSDGAAARYIGIEHRLEIKSASLVVREAEQKKREDEAKKTEEIRRLKGL